MSAHIFAVFNTNSAKEQFNTLFYDNSNIIQRKFIDIADKNDHLTYPARPDRSLSQLHEHMSSIHKLRCFG